jgi:hypothetical protein
VVVVVDTAVVEEATAVEAVVTVEVVVEVTEVVVVDLVVRNLISFCHCSCQCDQVPVDILEVAEDTEEEEDLEACFDDNLIVATRLANIFQAVTECPTSVLVSTTSTGTLSS